jgi:hypothetical protein
MVVDVSRPVRHRPETLREQNLRMEVASRQQEAIDLCDRLEPRLIRLYAATVLLGVVAEQLCAGALHDVRRYRERNG